MPNESSAMNKVLAVMFCLTFSLSIPIRANAGDAPPALASADWSVNGAHNLASNPPSLEAVKDFQNRFQGLSEEEASEFGDEVCEFRFADLRGSGNLSLITTVNPGGRQWPECNLLYIFDRTPKGFELYLANRAYGHDLANSVPDINHDGRHELVLWGELAPVATGPFNRDGLGCDAEWPLVFAWTGSGYSEASDQYKDYYRNYLKSLETQLAGYSPESGLAAAQTANPARTLPGFELSVGPSGEGLAPAPQPSLSQITAPAPTPEAAPTPRPGDYACTRIEAAKTEAFLGINSDSTMSAAIKDSESDDPNKRILAAAIFPYLGSQDAKADLKTLSNDADSGVAAIAKGAASMGEDPAQYYRTILRQGRGYVDFSESGQPKR
jgi:hypothetical protein